MMDFYDQILWSYENNNFSNEISELAFLKIMINLMNEYNYPNGEIKNYLIFLLNLMVIEEPDRFNTIGKAVNALTSHEQKLYLEILSQEFLS
ncbi:MAG: hypothetical protein KGD65_14185 [Candidatus Lokiarchaeota archaeon]|nr:hypothetical protein [Candidatus Lokiarchaeota archaeon]